MLQEGSLVLGEEVGHWDMEKYPPIRHGGRACPEKTGADTVPALSGDPHGHFFGLIDSIQGWLM